MLFVAEVLSLPLVSISSVSCLIGCEERLQIETVSPSVGHPKGGETLTIRGTGFGPGLRVQFGNEQVSDVTVVDEHTLRMTSPRGVVGPTDVVLRSERGIAYVRRSAFRYVVAPDDENPQNIASARLSPIGFSGFNTRVLPDAILHLMVFD